MAKEEKVNILHVAMGVLAGFGLMVAVTIVFLYVSFLKTGLAGNSVASFEPTRVVDTGDSTLQTVKNDLVASALRSLKGGNTQIVVTEEMLTLILREDMPLESEQDGLDISRSQVAIGDGVLEVFIPFERGDRSTAITMVLEPTLIDSNLHIEVVDARIGSLRAPDFLTSIPENIINDGIREQLGLLNASIQLNSFVIEDGEMIFFGTIPLDGASRF